MHFGADTDTKHFLSELVSITDADTAVLCSLKVGHIADRNYFYFIADTDTDK